MAVVASDQTHRIRLKFEPGTVHLNVLTPDLGEGHDEIEIGYDGEELEIVRHSMPYGSTTEHGLLFLAYSRDLSIYDKMLKRWSEWRAYET